MQVERVADDGTAIVLDDSLMAGVDTIVIISFDSFRTGQAASGPEIEAVRRFLSDPDHLIFVCPHHDIGEAAEVTADRRVERQTAEYLHHGDRASPPWQGFGGFAKTLLAGLGVPVDNRYGLRPATAPDGSPAPLEIERPLDILGLLDQVETLNLHPHLPQLERIGEAAGRLGVLARQQIDLAAPPHPAWPPHRTSFDAMLQSQPEVFAGTLLVCDTTLFSSTAGGADSLRRLWSNVLTRPERGSQEQRAE
jgi:hypothetical protein